MSNEKILKELEKETGYDERNNGFHEYSTNGEAFRCNMKNWNKEESEFPIDELKRYIRFNKWTKDDFSFENEQIVKEKLPGFVHDIFHEVKEFRQNSRCELTSVQVTLARMYGYPRETQDEKAFCVYDYAFKRYFENSELYKEKGNEG